MEKDDPPAEVLARNDGADGNGADRNGVDRHGGNMVERSLAVKRVAGANGLKRQGFSKF